MPLATRWSEDIAQNEQDNKTRIPGGEGTNPVSTFDPPTVMLPGGPVTITECARDLFKIIAPRHQIFARGKVVVSLTRATTGDFVLEPLKPSTARSTFEQYARFLVHRSGANGEAVLKRSVMPEETARALLDSEIASDLLPQIKGLTNCPIIFESEGILKVSGRGYSQETKMLIQRGEHPPSVPLDEAVNGLKALLKDFAFQTVGDNSRAMAAFIAPALKMGGLLQGFVPVDVAEADQSQSGKTYRQKVLGAIYGERPAIVSLKKNGVGSTDESFQERLVNGRPFIQFDNFRGKLDSPILESFLTAEYSFPCRIPYCREIEVDPSRFFLLMTSNGVETTRDLANRSSIVRIFKRPGAAFEDTLGIVQKNQAYYLGCVFSIIRDWHRHGSRRTSDTRHDFRHWAQTLDWIVQHICGLAPLTDGHQSAQERVSNPVLTFLRLVAIEAEKTDRLDENFSASELLELAETGGIEVPGLKGEENDEKARKILGIKLGPLFKSAERVQIDTFEVSRQIVRSQRKDGQGSFDSKAYAFSKVRPQAPQLPQQVE
ncbi:MAG: hypothetical protein JWL59_3099 [Chthoniobacteraceae bacterium]|nr:hypothetical protein [Chthoniobacteraceae bacterium]